jgi:hypothetical protein
MLGYTTVSDRNQDDRISDGEHLEQHSWQGRAVTRKGCRQASSKKTVNAENPRWKAMLGDDTVSTATEWPGKRLQGRGAKYGVHGYKSEQFIYKISKYGEDKTVVGMGAKEGVIDASVDVIAAATLRDYEATLDQKGIPHEWNAKDWDPKK